MTSQSFYRDGNGSLTIVHVAYSGPRRVKVSDKVGGYMPLIPSGYSRSHWRKLQKQRAACSAEGSRSES